MSASKVPQEMIHGIMYHLRKRKKSLKACSLVCKAWTHPARRFLFSRLTLKRPLQSAAFPFVRHLYISVDSLDYSYHTSALPWHRIPPLLVGFHRLVSLEISLSRFSLDVHSAQTWETLGTNFSNLASLCLRTKKKTDADSVFEFISAFPHLRELSICVFIYPTSPEQSSQAATFRISPNLHTLALNGSVAAVLDWIISLPVHPTLRTLRVYNLKDTDLAIFHKFIGVFGNTLESLTLSLSTSIKDWSRHSIDLSTLTRLRSISFVFFIEYGKGPQSVTQILSHISSAHLEEVAFKVQFPLGGGDVSTALEWSNLDAALQHERFSRLRSVYFLYNSLDPVCNSALLRTPSHTSVRQRLPLCHARGIFRVHQWSSCPSVESRFYV